MKHAVSRMDDGPRGGSGSFHAREMPMSVRAWQGYIAGRRRAAATVVTPTRRSRLRAALRQAARWAGARSARTWQASSPRVTSRTSCNPFSMCQWPRHRCSNAPPAPHPPAGAASSSGQTTTPHGCCRPGRRCHTRLRGGYGRPGPARASPDQLAIVPAAPAAPSSASSRSACASYGTSAVEHASVRRSSRSPCRAPATTTRARGVHGSAKLSATASRVSGWFSLRTTKECPLCARSAGTRRGWPRAHRR